MFFRLKYFLRSPIDAYIVHINLFWIINKSFYLGSKNIALKLWDVSSTSLSGKKNYGKNVSKKSLQYL